MKVEDVWEISNGETCETTEIFCRIATNRLDRSLLCWNTQNTKEAVGKRFNVLNNKYGILGYLGEGTFGKVYLGFDIEAKVRGNIKRLVAIKQATDSVLYNYAQSMGLKISTEEDKIKALQWAKLELAQKFAQEALLTGRLSTCENAVAIIDQDVRVPYIALEYCNGGTLKQRMMKEYRGSDIENWAKQIAHALSIAHSLKPDVLIHRDLKPHNILINNKKIKVSDFGTSMMRNEDQSLRSLCGGYTPKYAAPEAFEGRAYPQTDIWSLGVILYEAITRKLPFLGGPVEVMKNIFMSSPTDVRENARYKVSEKLYKLVMQSLEKNVDKRPCAKDYLNDSVITVESVQNDKHKEEVDNKKNKIYGFTYLQEKTYYCNGQKYTVDEYLHNRTEMEFVEIPSGSFMMGNKEHENEKPVHEVHINSFLISKIPVTQLIWKKVMRTAPWQGQNFVKEGPDFPATYVLWEDCKEFCRKTGLFFPTEAQWEYTCRAGSVDKYYWGSEMDENYAWYYDNTYNRNNRYAHQVGQKKANAFGLHDMIGNVWEWCQDWYDAKYYSVSSKDNPKGPDNGDVHVCRGSCWYKNASFCHSSHRDSPSSYYRFCMGFRPCYNKLKVRLKKK